MRMLALLLLLATVAQAGDATWTWSASTKNTDGSALIGAVTYNLFTGPQGQPKTLTASGLSALTLKTTGWPGGTNVCGQVTASVVGEDDSDLSNEVCKLIPKLKPTPPVMLTVVTTAYQVQGGKPVLIGRVPLQTTCGADAHRKVGGRELFNVPRSKVNFTRRDNRTQTFGVCA